MKIIKLDAIDSTNDFLKRMTLNLPLQNGTVVQTDYQFKGRGQTNNTWYSEKDKNLLFSVLYTFDNLKIKNRFYLNKIVSIAVFEVLNTYTSTIKIKWPNDIMASNKKIGGILIENIFNSNKISQTIIGVGINVNQLFFEEVSQATSLKILLDKEFNVDFILLEILDRLNKQIDLVIQEKFSEIDNLYFTNLYRFKKPAMYRDKNGFFMGKIIHIEQTGMLKMELENESVKYFDLKEIKFL